MIMKTQTVKWLISGAVGAGMLAFSVSANAAGSTGAAISQPAPSQILQLAAKDCGGVIKASAMKDDDKMAMKDDKMAMKDDDKMAMKDDDKMAMADDCADKDTMKN